MQKCKSRNLHISPVEAAVRYKPPVLLLGGGLTPQPPNKDLIPMNITINTQAEHQPNSRIRGWAIQENLVEVV